MIVTFMLLIFILSKKLQNPAYNVNSLIQSNRLWIKRLLIVLVINNLAAFSVTPDVTQSVTLAKKTKLFTELKMKTITNFKYLFQRNHVYYFRFKLTKHLPQQEITISLKTKILADAVFLWQKLFPYTEKLKQLQINQTDALICELERDCIGGYSYCLWLACHSTIECRSSTLF